MHGEVERRIEDISDRGDKNARGIADLEINFDRINLAFREKLLVLNSPVNIINLSTVFPSSSAATPKVALVPSLDQILKFALLRILFCII